MKPLPSHLANPLFIDLGFSQKNKSGETICGDCFKFQKSPDGARLTAVLSDGLGSGVKAGILSSITAVMALKFASTEDTAILHAADTIMGALPICRERRTTYATFTIVTASLSGDVRIVEMGNPPFLLFHSGKCTPLPEGAQTSEQWHDRTVRQSRFRAGTGDRIVFFSDGVSQAGLGTKENPLGWLEPECAAEIAELLALQPDISSRELCSRVVELASGKETRWVNPDDITCASLNFRRAHCMLLFTGPPYDSTRDRECAEAVASFPGDKAVCGGTTADIVGRELGREVRTDLRELSADLPPAASIDGINLVTEGVFTLTKTASYLENLWGRFPRNPAGELAELLLRNDEIDFLVGTRVNEAHQDPNLPQELELRRNIVGRMARVLKEKFYKKINIRYV